MLIVPAALLSTARLNGSPVGSGTMETSPAVVELPVSATVPRPVGLRMAPPVCSWAFAIMPPPGAQATAASVRAWIELFSGARSNRPGDEAPTSGPAVGAVWSGGAVWVLDCTAMPRAVSAAPRLLAVAVELGLVPPFIVASVTASLAV